MRGVYGQINSWEGSGRNIKGRGGVFEGNPAIRLALLIIPNISRHLVVLTRYTYNNLGAIARIIF